MISTLVLQPNEINQIWGYVLFLNNFRKNKNKNIFWAKYSASRLPGRTAVHMVLLILHPNLRPGSNLPGTRGVEWLESYCKLCP